MKFIKFILFFLGVNVSIQTLKPSFATPLVNFVTGLNVKGWVVNHTFSYLSTWGGTMGVGVLVGTYAWGWKKSIQRTIINKIVNTLGTKKGTTEDNINQCTLSAQNHIIEDLGSRMDELKKVLADSTKTTHEQLKILQTRSNEGLEETKQVKTDVGTLTGDVRILEERIKRLEEEIQKEKEQRKKSRNDLKSKPNLAVNNQTQSTLVFTFDPPALSHHESFPFSYNQEEIPSKKRKLCHITSNDFSSPYKATDTNPLNTTPPTLLRELRKINKEKKEKPTAPSSSNNRAIKNKAFWFAPVEGSYDKNQLDSREGTSLSSASFQTNHANPSFQAADYWTAGLGASLAHHPFRGKALCQPILSLFAFAARNAPK
jgi:hypothetical protein